ncbi:MAG: tyrosine-type recombinase/integrase [Isosphaerales bacterium]
MLPIPAPAYDLYDLSQPIAAVGPIPFDAFVIELLRLYDPSLRSKDTRRQVVSTIKTLELAGVRSTGDLTVSLLAKLVATRDPKLSPNTVRTLLRSVQSICSHAANCGYLAVNPFVVRPLRTWVRPAPSKFKQYLTRDEIRRMMDVLAGDIEVKLGYTLWCARRIQALFMLCVLTGLRRGEALWLMTMDLDLQERVVYVVDRSSHRLKTALAAQPVALPEQLIPYLTSWLSHRMDAPPGPIERPPSAYVFPCWTRSSPWTSGSTGSSPLVRLRTIGERAGVQGVTFKALRKSTATHLEGHGAGPAAIQRILRHSSVETAERFYRKFDLANMRATMEGFAF